MPGLLSAELSAADLAAIIVAIASVVAVVLLIFVVVAVNRTLSELRLSIEQVRRETMPVVDELHRTVTTANAELQRLDVFLDSASHLAYLAFSNPLIKVMALATGTAKAAKALRRG